MSRVPSDSLFKSSELFKRRLNEAIADSDCSIYEFAKKAEVSKGVITRASIYGIIPSVRPLIKIADTVELSLEFLLGLSDVSAFTIAIPKSSFHVRLKELCLERKVKYSQIGKHMPFSTNLFYDWLRENTIPSLEYLIAIANYFEVSIDYLLGRTDDRTN